MQHNLSRALATDIMYAVIEYKWQAFAMAKFWKESMYYSLYVALYVAFAIMSVNHSGHEVTWAELCSVLIGCTVCTGIVLIYCTAI